MTQKCIQYIMKENLLLLIAIRTLKDKIYKHMTAVSKNVYFDVLDGIVDKYNNTQHTTINMKPMDTKNT